ncbi:hypothetical protein BC830DRAFT_1139585 [Chytriomyces sp. MP71]|nr:hypothetical protein BC830DRAFT_1139585 [Chytriomyces sp. MP71]
MIVPFELSSHSAAEWVASAKENSPLCRGCCMCCIACVRGGAACAASNASGSGLWSRGKLPTRHTILLVVPQGNDKHWASMSHQPSSSSALPRQRGIQPSRQPGPTGVSGSVTVFVGETGKAVQVPLAQTDGASLIEVVTHATGIGASDLILLSAKGAVVATLSESMNQDPVFAFSRASLSAPPRDKPELSEQVFLLPEVPRSVLVPLSIHTTASISAVVSACFDTFKSNYDYARAIVESAEHHVALMDQLLNEQKIQAKALRAAVMSLQVHSKPVVDAFDGFMAHTQSEIARNNALIQTFPADLQALHRIPIHPAISRSENPKFLSDYVPEERLLTWADKCRAAQEEFVRQTIALSDSVRNLKSGTEMEVNRDLDVDFDGLQNLLKASQHNLSTLQQTASLLSRDFNRVQSVLADIRSRSNANLASSLTSSLSDTFPQQTLTALEGLQEIHSSEYIPALATADSHIRAGLHATLTSRMHAGSALRTRLGAVSHLQSVIAGQIAPAMQKLGLGAGSLKAGFAQLLHVHRMPAAWGALLCEVVRRKEFAGVVTARVEAFAGVLKRLGDVEKKRREGFEGEIGRYLPRDEGPEGGGKTIVTGLEDGIPKAEMRVVKGVERLPEIGRSDLYDFEQFIAQIRAAMTDVDPSSSASPSTANQTLTSSHASSAKGGPGDSISKLSATLTKMAPQIDSVRSEFDRLIARSGVCGDRVARLEEENARLKAELARGAVSMARTGSGGGVAAVGSGSLRYEVPPQPLASSPGSAPFTGRRTTSKAASAGSMDSELSRAEETIKAYENRIRTLEDLLQRSYHMGSSRMMDASTAGPGLGGANVSPEQHTVLQTENSTLRTRLNLLESQFASTSTSLREREIKLKEALHEFERVKPVLENERSLRGKAVELEKEVSELRTLLQEKDREGRVVVGEVERCAGFVREVYELLDDCVGAFRVRGDQEHEVIGGLLATPSSHEPLQLPLQSTQDRRYSSAASSLGKYQSPTSPSVGLMALVNAATSFGGGGGVGSHVGRSQSQSGSHPQAPVLTILSTLRTDEREIRRRLRELQDDIRCQALELIGLQDELVMANTAAAAAGASNYGASVNVDGGSLLSPETSNGEPMLFGSPGGGASIEEASHSGISAQGTTAVRSITSPFIEELHLTKKEVHRLNAIIDDLNTSLEKANALSAKYGELLLELPDKDAQISQLTESTKQWEAEKADLIEAADQNAKKLERVSSVLTTLQAEKADLELKLSEVIREMALSKQVQSQTHSDWQLKHNELSSYSQTLEAQIRSLTGRLAQQDATLNLKVSEYERGNFEFTNTISTLNTCIEGLNAKIATLERDISKNDLTVRQKDAEISRLGDVSDKFRVTLGREKGRIQKLKEKIEDWSLVCKMAIECLTVRFDALGNVGNSLAQMDFFVQAFVQNGGNVEAILNEAAIPAEIESPLRIKQLLHDQYRLALNISSSLSNSLGDDVEFDAVGESKAQPVLELRETYLNMIGLMDSIDVAGWSDGVVRSVHHWKEAMLSQSLRKSILRESKIAFSSFKEGDLALFLPTRNPKAWAAFNVNAPHYFLSISSAETLFPSQIKNRDWILGIIMSIDARKVEQSTKSLTNSSVDAPAADEQNDSNPFGLAAGSKFFMCNVIPWK